MKRSVSSQNFCRLSERHASPEDPDKQGAVLQKLLSWVYWLYVFQSNCQLLPSVFISFFIFYFTIFRHPPKPSHAAWPSNFRPRAWSTQHRSPAMGLGMLVPSTRGSSVIPFSGSLTGSFPRCLHAWSPEACHSLLFISLDEILTNLFLQTAMYLLCGKLIHL